MKIRIEDIPEHGLELDLTEEGAAIAELAGGHDFSIPAPVAAHLEIRRLDGAVEVDGTVAATLVFECGRCTKPFEYKIDSAFNLLFVRPPRNEHDVELRPDDLEVNYLEGPEVDTTDLVLAQLALESPVKPLCSEDCKGLCQTCGADLNDGPPCGCEQKEHVDNRFAVLKGFKVKK